MKDGFGREIDYMRISVTDRCNLRCVYCMPENGVPLLSHKDILSYEEILRLVRIAAENGIKKIRLTGGEPLVRRGIENLIKDIKSVPGIDTVGITTNGILIPEKIDSLTEAGLDCVNISLDTLREDRFESITRRTGLCDVLHAIDLCCERGLNTKINCVAMKGVNDDEFSEIAGLAKDRNICVRFIEYMPVGKNDFEKYVPTGEIRSQIEKNYGKLSDDATKHGSGPANYVKPYGFKGSVGFISAMTNCFCDSCNRIRLTAEGYLKLCLQFSTGVSLREIMRSGADDAAVTEAFRSAILNKPRKHTFNDYADKENIEDRGMSRIGG